MVIDIENCSSCGDDHTGLKLYPLDNTFEGYTDFVVCPTSEITVLVKEV